MKTVRQPHFRLLELGKSLTWLHFDQKSEALRTRRRPSENEEPRTPRVGSHKSSQRGGTVRDLRLKQEERVTQKAFEPSRRIDECRRNHSCSPSFPFQLSSQSKCRDPKERETLKPGDWGTTERPIYSGSVFVYKYVYVCQVYHIKKVNLLTRLCLLSSTCLHP